MTSNSSVRFPNETAAYRDAREDEDYDGLNGTAPHVRDRVSFAVVATSPIDRVRQIARDRGWRNLRLVSSSRSSYNHDYHGETAGGEQMPVLNVFVKRDGAVYHGLAAKTM